jgi:uncharacterized protein YxjI
MCTKLEGVLANNAVKDGTTTWIQISKSLLLTMMRKKSSLMLTKSMEISGPILPNYSMEGK